LYNYLSEHNPEDINFWQPGGNVRFKILGPGAPFLFKLKAPVNAIGGVGFFQVILFYQFQSRGIHLVIEMAVVRTTNSKERFLITGMIK